MHTLHSRMDVKAYAENVGRAHQRVTVQREVMAARVAEACSTLNTGAPFMQLVEIHAAPRWLWSSLVEAMVADGLTVDATRKLLAGVKGRLRPPFFIDHAIVS